MKINHHQLNLIGEQMMNLSAVLGSISGTAVAFFIFKAVWPLVIGCATTVATHFLSRYLKKKRP